MNQAIVDVLMIYAIVAVAFFLLGLAAGIWIGRGSADAAAGTT